MPLPAIDNRSYQQLVDEALARIPVHNPEWTNFNRSDPGVTLVELFAFLMESVAYRSNQIPERNRRKFLSLLGVPLSPATSARGIVTLANPRGPLEAVTLNEGIEVRAGSVAYRTELGLDVLPIEARAFVKRPVAPSQDLLGYYQQLYASYVGPKPRLAEKLQLYEVVPLDGLGSAGAALQETADDSLWVALLLRPGDPPAQSLALAREKLAGRTLSLGIAPVIDDPDAQLAPGAHSWAQAEAPLEFQLPRPPDHGLLPTDPEKRIPEYATLSPSTDVNVLATPGVVQLTLPGKEQLGLWENLEPIESGVGEFPPALEDTKLAARIVTWLRVKAVSGAQAAILWAGVNASPISQRQHVSSEPLPDGTGEPDQAVRLRRVPVIPESVRLTVQPQGGAPERWTLIDDLFAAAPEVTGSDPRMPPGSPAPRPADPRVFVLDPTSGEVRFGDGARGKRPPAEANLRADYDFGAGAAGNVGPDQIRAAPGLPTGLTVTNPLPTWGGADAETVEAGERQAARYLQHRDRLVSATDFATIARRTPGVEMGRVDVLPAYNPELAPSQAGDAAGAVTLMLVPRRDARHPAAPEPDQPFLDAVCAYLDPRRLVTTEVFLRGPRYKAVLVAVGVDVVPGESVAAVREAVKAELERFLAPVDPSLGEWHDDPPASLSGPYTHHQRGWPLQKSVRSLELAAVAARVPGVVTVNGVELAEGAGDAVDAVPMTGLELPRAAVAVSAGAPPSLDELRGQRPPDSEPPSVVPVPLVPETC